MLSAQIKVDSNGKVALKSSTTLSSYDIFLNGSTLIWGTANFSSNGVPSLIISSSANTPTVRPMLPNNGYIGTPIYQFSNIYGQYHYAGLILLTSDKRFKENFRTIDQPLVKILKLTGKKYDFITESSDTVGTAQEKEKKDKLKKDKLGFIAQEVQEILPEAVVYDKEIDRYYIDYNAVIPVIVEAIKELKTEIDVLKAENNKLKSSLVEKSASIYSDTEQAATLSQNIPNPFSETTRIAITLPQSVNQATLYLYNMQGVQMKSFVLTERGNTNVTIEGNSLKAGMYLYTLIADGKEVDSKKMILTK